MERLIFLNDSLAREVQSQFGTPTYVYDQNALERQASEALAFPNPYGLTVRYAMKACPNGAVIRVLHRQGLKIDASSGFEVRRAMAAGVPASDVMLTAQELAPDFVDLVEKGCRFNACSLRQLRAYGEAFPGREVAVRINPGLGSGHSNRTNVGGPSASFGIWHEHLDEVVALAAQYELEINLLHTHIGSGSDPEVWQRCASMTLGIASRLPQVRAVSLGGGFKVGRMVDEQSTDLAVAGAPVAEELVHFAEKHGRELQLEIEPGTFLVAQAGVLVCSVADMTDTGPQGYEFIKLDAGMTEILRPSLYGAQHPIVVVPTDDGPRASRQYLVVGHCCESGDVLTPEPGNPEGLQARELTEARPGDAVVIGGCGAYCSAMAAVNYNAFPKAPELLLGTDGDLHLIRRRQTFEEMLEDEILPPSLG